MNYREFKKMFFTPKMNKILLISSIKVAFENFHELLKFSSHIDREIKSAKDLIYKLLIENCLPKNYEKLQNDNASYYTDSFIKELNWQALSFVKASRIVNDFIKLRSVFEHFLLIGDYPSARSTLEKIEKEICVSYWGIENKLILDEYQFGTEKNWETRSEIINNKHHPFVQFFGDLFSLKAEVKHSFFQYNEHVDTYIQQIQEQKDGDSTMFQDFILFKGNFFSYPSNKKISPYILFWEGNSSMIDRYILFIRVCQYSIANESNDTLEIIQILKELMRRINDPSVNQILSMTETYYSIKAEDESVSIINVVDEYTKGNYQKCLENTRACLMKNSSVSFELIEIYSKSLVEIGAIEFTEIQSNKCFVNEISELYYNVLKKNENYDNAILKLIKLAYVFSNSSMGVHLYAFISKELGEDDNHRYSILSGLNSKFTNPNMSFSLINRSQTYLYYYNKSLQNKYENSLTTRLFQSLSNGIELKESALNEIPEIKRDLYALRILMLRNDFESCAQRYSQIYEQHQNLSIINIFEIASNLFNCYLQLGDHYNCTKLYVDVFFLNNQLTSKMNPSLLAKKIIEDKFKKIKDREKFIELPILFKISTNNKIRIKHAYDLFLKANKCERPSEIFNLINSFPRNKFIYFLRYVCSVEIMVLSTHFNSTFIVNEERINICKFLVHNDKENESFYNKEIAKLTKENTINKVIGSIDDRKIFVNEEKIRQILKNSDTQKILKPEQQSILTNEYFERYSNLLEYAKNNNYRHIATTFEIGEKGEVIPIEIIYQSDSSYLAPFKIFSKYFLYIRDLFVFNKEYGLDAYLSTRIRHGTLPNHLRSVFESYSLITSQTDNVYNKNLFWENKLQLSEENGSLIQKRFAEFSKEIDSLSTKIKDNYIQCTKHFEYNDPALFDFVYDEKNLYKLFYDEFRSLGTMDEFIDKSIAELWLRTEDCLKTIRYEFETNIKNFYIDIIDRFKEDVLKIENRNTLGDLINALMTCRTEIQTKIGNISKWFRRSEGSFDGEYSLQTLTDVSIQITKNIHPTYLFEAISEIDSTIHVKGEYHQYFIDIINNFLFNMIKHSELESNLLNAKINIRTNQGKINMFFCNNVSNKGKHFKNLEAIKQGWDNMGSNISFEGGSGFPKIKKIINSDLNRKFSTFDFSFDENELTISITFENNDLSI